ncbi:MAG: hypothetical protein OSA97_00505 [Nevskia sp.]|nr:hypothetical protein [Nevskia sp.]
MWPTPNVPNGGRTLSEEEVLAKGTTEDGKRQVGLEMATRFWPTPNAGDDRGPSPGWEAAAQRHAENGVHKQMLLRDYASRWPTPNALEYGAANVPALLSRREKYQEKYGNNGFGLTLGQAVAAQLWPTPHGFQAGNGPDGNEFSTAVRRWATPKASDGPNGGPNMSGSKGDLPLPAMAASWASPTARIFRGGGQATTRPDGKSRMDMLDFQAEGYSRPVLSLNTGDALSPTTRSLRRRLNPAFVCWLMGWPTWWTNPAPISCAAREMASYRYRLRWRLSCLLGAAGCSDPEPAGSAPC